MKLYDVPNYTKVRIIDEFIKIPGGAPELKQGDIVKFHRIDGRYSLCTIDKKIVHLAANTEVEIVEDNNENSKTIND